MVSARQQLRSVVKYSRIWLRKQRAKMQAVIADHLEHFCSKDMMTQLMIRWYLQVKPK